MYIVIPSFEGIELMSSFQAAHTHVYILKSIYKSCPCPSCGKISSRVHSLYTRFVQDLAIQQTSIHLQLQVKKFFCDSPACSTRIFTERFAWLQSYQRKIIKYNHLIANCVIFYNVFQLTHILHEYIQEGNELDEEVLSDLSPYLAFHINRFRKYGLDDNRQPPDIKFDMAISPNGLKAAN
ncbi:Tn3 family transposase [Bacillus cytotoxicus]|uniref:Tn3 family transposase n=1 Tax=Bacillus cytotoxicus TaxID=580165 RepID=UPI003D7C77DC